MTAFVLILIAICLLTASTGFVTYLSGIRQRMYVESRLLECSRDHAFLASWQAVVRFYERFDRGESFRMLRSAGFTDAYAPSTLVALRTASAIVMTCICAISYGRAHGMIATSLLSAFVFFLVWRLWVTALKIRMETRARRIRDELPGLIDMLLMVIDSGVSLDQALRHTALLAAKCLPVSSGLLARFTAEIDAGVPHDVALTRLGSRMGHAEGSDFSGLLCQALLTGSEIGAPLRRFSADLCDRQMSRMRESMGRRSTHLTIAMLIFFMPVLLIILAGPAVTTLSVTLHSVAVAGRH